MDNESLRQILEEAVTAASGQNHISAPESGDLGITVNVRSGIAGIMGLSDIETDGLIEFEDKSLAVAMNLESDMVMAALLDAGTSVKAGMKARTKGGVISIPVSEELLGRIVDPLGRPLDGLGSVKQGKLMPIEKKAPSIFMRRPVEVPLQTGILPVDALIPVGRGQRELIIGDRQTGKTSLAIDSIINQRDNDVICIYCSIGRQSTSVAKVIDDLKKYAAFEKVIIVSVSGEQSAYLNFAAPYSATTIAEYFMEKGRDVLVIYDDLTSHARSYRELSLLLRRPPAREAYPGDIFFIHSRLLERATRLKPEFGGGSITAMPIVETEAQNIAAYIPTNLVSITDGQIYLSPKLFNSGIIPAVDVGKSVSRVGGNAQVKVYHNIAGALKLAFAQYEELESFSRFGTKLDDGTRKILERGRVIRELLKQPQYRPIATVAQIVLLYGLNAGKYDGMDVRKFRDCRDKIIEKSGEINDTGFKEELLLSEKISVSNLEVIQNILENSHPR